MKKNIRFCFILLLVALFPLICLIAGCGGGGSNTLDQSGNGTLTSDSKIWLNGMYCTNLKSFTAKNNGYISVEMKKSGSNPIIDPFVLILKGVCKTNEECNASYNQYGYLTYDNDSGTGNDAHAIFYATKGQDFTVSFTNNIAYSYGTYSWHVYESNQSSSSTALQNDSENSKLMIDVRKIKFTEIK